MRVESTHAAGTRRRGLGCGTALMVGAVVFLCVTVLSAAVFALSPGRGTGFSASFIPRQPGAIPWNGRDRLNLLLMTSKASSGSDVVMVLSYDPASQSLTLLSLPGNLWITIPGGGQARLSQVPLGANGRLGLLAAETVTHVPISYYASLSSHAMAQIIDALGGISVPGGGASTHGAATRFMHMSGTSTISYVATNGRAGGAEMQQVFRSQQVVMAALKSAAQPSIIFQIPTIVNTLGGSVPTNFPYDEVPSLVHALLSIPRSNVHTDQLDYKNGTVSEYAGDGGAVLLPDWQHIRFLAQRDLGHPSLISRVRVRVLNGGGVAGQASHLARWLKQSGISVSGYSSAPSFAHPHTQVLLSPRASIGTTRVARTVATLLQVPLVVDPGAGPMAAVTVVIGRDFLDPTQQ